MFLYFQKKKKRFFLKKNSRAHSNTDGKHTQIISLTFIHHHITRVINCVAENINGIEENHEKKLT